jgi:hypothetical protein
VLPPELLLGLRARRLAEAAPIHLESLPIRLIVARQHSQSHREMRRTCNTDAGCAPD